MNSIVMPATSTYARLTFTKATRAHEEHPAYNADYGLTDPQSRLAVICDGVGGVIGADLAARLAARTIRKRWRHLLTRMGEMPLKESEEQTILQLEPILRQLLEEANTVVLAKGKRLAKSKKDFDKKEAYSQTTIALALLLPVEKGYLMGYAHIGDSRVYLLRKTAGLQRLTADDGYFEWKINKGELNPQDAWHIEQATAAEQLSEQEHEHFDRRNKISQSLGDEDLTMHVGQTSLYPGDRVLLCTDGIHDNLTDAEIEATLRKGARTTLAKTLLKQTLERSQHDKNVCLRAKKDDMSAIVISCHSLPENTL